MRNTVLLGDVRERLKEVPSKSVQCCVTSPPYWGLRDYGHEGQIGLEQAPDEYIAEMVVVFREVHRVLRDDGVLWLNLGDSYIGSGRGPEGNMNKGYTFRQVPHNTVKSPAGFKPKDLVGIPWRVAFALQADGWYLRADIIWHKGVVMPESVRDRPTKAHEYIFLLTKQPRYFYDDVAVKESSVVSGLDVRNRRSVWQINPKPYKGAHFATFPEELPEVCIKAGTSEKGACRSCGAPWERVIERGEVVSEGGSDTGIRAANLESVSPLKPSLIDAHNTGRMVQREQLTKGWEPTCDCPDNEPVPCVVLDPFSGSGTTLAVAKYLRRDYLGVELNPEYHGLIEKRLRPAEELESERRAFEDVMMMDE